jgi:FKBP-type peptidyl-prolyl cis-trans isomerase FklB
MVKKFLVISLASAALLPILTQAASAPQLTTDGDKLSYAMGYTTGQALSSYGIELNLDAYNAGIKTGLANAKPALSDQQIAETLQGFQKQQIKKMTQQRMDDAAKNLKEGEAFLANNKKKNGVQVTPNGLQYRELTPGKGKSPIPTDTVTVNYEGRLLNGTIFDSSYKRNKPISFALNGVIKGWQEALVMMKPGATWEVFIPSSLAYGSTGIPGSDIGPNETLIFKINLISVEAQKNS